MEPTQLVNKLIKMYHYFINGTYIYFCESYIKPF